jgi:hypothetical protein
MTVELSVDGITGIDGKVPVYEPNARWTTWSLKEIYLGQQGEKRYVPKVDDHVRDPDTNALRQVVSIDPTTMIPTMKLVHEIHLGEFNDNDLLLGVGPGTPSDTYRIYIDKSVMPHTLAVDARLSVKGSMVSSCKIFRGSNILGTAECISATYDSSGNLLGQAIPLELVQMKIEDGFNLNVWTVPVCHTTFSVPDNEILTAVFYSDTGHVVSKRQLLAENSGFIRSVETSVKYISSISLESPFLSTGDPKLLQYPLNVPLSGLSLMGIVNYSDGSQKRMPVDGTKFSIFGFEHYASTIVGQKFGLILKYTLSADEIVYGSTVVGGHFMTETYKATTIKAEGAFTVKVFGYPVWIDGTNGYRMEWFMYNLDRNVAYRVTPYVRFNDNTRIFDPVGYGIHQNLSIALNLKDVNGAFTSYTHIQTIGIVLIAPGTGRTTNWNIAFDPGQDPAFGTGNFASTTFVNSNLSKVRIDCGATTQSEWLDRLYYRTKPLMDDSRELAPPAPDFFKLVIGNEEIEFPISQWNAEQIINTVLINSGTLFIKFFKRTSDNDIQLAVSGIPVFQQN